MLSRLDGVKETGRARWVAICPSHEDGRPSLSIREGDDGRVLLHCFAGCANVDVVHDLGLGFGSLFPVTDHRDVGTYREAKRVRRPRLGAGELLELLDREATVLDLYNRAFLGRLEAGEPVADLVERHGGDYRQALDRIETIREEWRELL